MNRQNLFQAVNKFNARFQAEIKEPLEIRLNENCTAVLFLSSDNTLEENRGNILYKVPPDISRYIIEEFLRPTQEDKKRVLIELGVKVRD